MSHVRVLFGAILLTACISARANDSAREDVDVTPEDTHVLCYNYLYGNGTKAAYDKALKWCRIAAANGVPSSEVLLGEIYYFGRGTSIDLAKAARWYEKAALAQHPHAQFMLYQLYVADNYGDEAQKAHGLEMLKAAAESGYERARDELAKLNSDVPK